MIRLASIRLPLDAGPQDLPRIAASHLSLPPEKILDCRLLRRAVDARRREDVHFVATLDVLVDEDESLVLKRCASGCASLAPAPMPPPAPRLPYAGEKRPIVVGAGPAGLFAALTLAKAGARPILLERGRDAQTRLSDVQAFWSKGVLDERSNVQFGEGGAGTFSDGKLNTGIKNPRCAEVLATFVRCGAPEEILWQAKPHIGTDQLVQMVARMRKEIEALGGEVQFSAQMTDLQVENGKLRGVWVNEAFIDADRLILAIGHSGRDTYRMLHSRGVHMIPKPFSIGARIEHPQRAVDIAQYGRFAGHEALGPAEYKLSAHLQNGRGVYTFCMCPGGQVVAAASEAGGVVTNGMSNHRRDGANANSALLVDVRVDDFPADEGPLAGISFQQQWERLAFLAGGGNYCAPMQRVADFLGERPSTAIGAIAPTYRPGVTPADLRACLPPFVTASMREAIGIFGRRLKGFDHPDAVLTGVETRSSSPVRILRGEQGQANIWGVFPAGEGAGYAGGIVSAAVDGIRAAEWALETN